MGHPSILKLLERGIPLNIAHRGARSLAPENTLESAQLAFAVGADLWEIDVSLTRDGEPVVIHDETLERTSNASVVFPLARPWRVHDFTLEALRGLDFGSWFVETDPFGQIAAGAVPASACRRFRGVRIPTLEEALLATREAGRAVNIEIKGGLRERSTPSIVERVVSLVHRLEMTDRVIVSSFHHAHLERVRHLSPSMPCGMLTHRSMSGVREALQRLAPAIYHPRITACPPREIRSLRQDGFHVLPWVANDHATMRRLLESGASGLFTDFPQDLAALLRNGVPL